LTEAHFTRDDLIGVAAGTLILAPFLLSPGYFFGWIFDLFGFRRESRAWQALLALALSVSIAPVFAFLIARYLGDAALWSFYALTCAFALFVAIRPSPDRPPSRIPRWILWTLAGWMAIVWFSGIDLQIVNRLYPPVLAYDFNLRTAVVDSLSRHGLPAINPLFYPGHFVPLRYHFFWFLPITLAHRLGGSLIGSRQALIAADVWCGWALMAVVTLYLRFFKSSSRPLKRRAKWAIALLAVGGLSVIPNLFYDIANRLGGGWFVYSSAEWWNNQIDPFPHSTFFEAHHVAGLLACLTGFLLLWTAKRAANPFGPAICAGLCFASAAGTSIYVTFTFAIFLALWGALVILRGTKTERQNWILSGAVAIVFAAPYLLALRGAAGPAGAFVQPTIRSFTPVETVMDALHFPWIQIALANLVTLPLNYFLESGVWMLLAALWIARARRRMGRSHLSPSNPQQAALAMFAVSLCIATFLRSAVINNNDLGWRSVLVAQFIVIVWSVDPLRALWRSRRWTSRVPQTTRDRKLRRWQFRIAALLILGLASTLYDFSIMRLYFILSDHGALPPATWMSKDTEVGHRTFDAREFYASLNATIPAAAILQSNPQNWSDVYHGLYSGRQTASFDFICGAGMGGDPAQCRPMQDQLTTLFDDPGAAQHLDIDQVCRAWGINVLVAKDVDPIFQDHDGWPWTRTPLTANDKFRAIACGR